MSTMNRLANCKNEYQGNYKRVLCVCSAGLLRSPTAALVLSQEPYNYNTRAAGLDEDFALVVVNDVLLKWADEVVCMTSTQKIDLEIKLNETKLTKPVICLHIKDSYSYRDPELIELIKNNYENERGK